MTRITSITAIWFMYEADISIAQFAKVWRNRTFPVLGKLGHLKSVHENSGHNNDIVFTQTKLLIISSKLHEVKIVWPTKEIVRHT